MAGQGAADHLQLRVPGLAGVHQVTAGLNSLGQAAQGVANHLVAGEQFIQARDHCQGRAWVEAGQALGIEGIALDEAGNVGQAFFGDQRAALLDVELAVVAQQDRLRLALQALQRFEDVAAMAGGDIDDIHRLALFAQALDGQAQQFLDMQLALADAAPADGVEVVLVDHPPDRALAGGLVAVDVVQRAARVEAGVKAQLDPVRQALAQP
ncbi:hypothetical protein D9M71_419010 [compost metagenome]